MAAVTLHCHSTKSTARAEENSTTNTKVVLNH